MIELRHYIIAVFVISVSFLMPILLIAADVDTIPHVPSIKVADPTLHTGLHVTRILPSNYYVRGSNIKGEALTMGMAPFVEYTVRNAPGSRYGRWYPSAYQGVGASVQFSVPSGILGTPCLLYVMQGARLASFSPRLSFDYVWNFGAAVGWKSMDHDSPAYNRNIDVMGTPVTAYINLGLYLRYRLTEHISVMGGVEATHYSNGNTGDPNPGLNMLGMRIGLSYNFGGADGLRKADWSDFEPGMVYDISVYGAWRKWLYKPYEYSETDENVKMLVPGKFGVAGFNINPMYRFNPVVSAGLSMDGQYDEGANLTPNYVTTSPPDNPKFYRTSFCDRVSLGLSARVELRMSLFAINIGLGHSIYAPGSHDLRGWYNVFALKTFVTDRLFLLTGYRLIRFNVPGNLMLGAGFRI